MIFIWISELSGGTARAFTSPRLLRLAFCSISPILVAFSLALAQCHSLHRPFPSLYLPPMLLPEKNTPTGMALYHDVGYGLPRAGSQNFRKFRMPVVYSNPLADLCANC
jgi:hypothetical protein